MYIIDNYSSDLFIAIPFFQTQARRPHRPVAELMPKHSSLKNAPCMASQ